MTHAVVMAGGGASASFEVGVLLKMDANGTKIDAVYGTSAGALNAAGYAFGGSEKLESMWRGISSWKDLWSINVKAFAGFGSGILNSKPLRRKIDRICRGKASIPCCVTKVDMTNGDLVYSYAGDPGFSSSVEASAALPGIISPIGGRYSDGGIREICPLQRAIDDGHDHISVILCHPSETIEHWEPRDGFLGFLETALRADAIRGQEILKDDIARWLGRIAITIYAPDREILGCLDFERDQISDAIQAGMMVNGLHFSKS